jgi:hypothetical protein
MSKYYVSGADIRRLMRRNHVTIRELTKWFHITLKRVRYVRENGSETYLVYCDWH